MRCNSARNKINPETVHFKHWLAKISKTSRFIKIRIDIFLNSYFSWLQKQNSTTTESKCNIEGPSRANHLHFLPSWEEGLGQRQKPRRVTNFAHSQAPFSASQAPPPLCSLSSASGHAPRLTSQASFPGASSLHHAGSESLPPAHSSTAQIPLFCLTSSPLPNSQAPSNRRPPLPPDAT